MVSWKTDDNVHHEIDEYAIFGGRKGTVVPRVASICGTDLWLASKVEDPVDCMTCLVKEARRAAA